VTFSREAREAFLRFATSPAAAWTANFRDFNGALVRMATLAPGGRITTAVVQDEVARLAAAWAGPLTPAGDGLAARFVAADVLARIDRFERVQLEDVLRVCREARTLSEAGRRLFSVSRARRTTANDADRLRKYLARFGLSWRDLQDSS
jgi:transcriptional regulatory protein RtcR